jgi:hypothetical protein
MPVKSRSRIREPFTPELDLPPPFRSVALREIGDAFAHAIKIAADAGAGTLVHIDRFDLAEFAVVLEPEAPLRTARCAIYAGLTALADSLAAHAPPEKPITIDWPDAIRIDGGLVGGARLAWPEGADEEAPPSWLVFSAMIRNVATGDQEAALHPHATALYDEGFDLAPGRLIGSFARHLMAAIDTWQQDGLAEVANCYLLRVAAESGVHCNIADNGDLLVRRDHDLLQRRSLMATLATPSWLDPATEGPRL